MDGFVENCDWWRTFATTKERTVAFDAAKSSLKVPGEEQMELRRVENLRAAMDPDVIKYIASHPHAAGLPASMIRRILDYQDGHPQITPLQRDTKRGMDLIQKEMENMSKELIDQEGLNAQQQNRTADALWVAYKRLCMPPGCVDKKNPIDEKLMNLWPLVHKCVCLKMKAEKEASAVA